MAEVSLGFINDDVRTQLKEAKEILGVARDLEKMLPTVTGNVRSDIEKCIDRLVAIASSLTANANTTSSNAAITVESSTGSAITASGLRIFGGAERETK
jgi:hypothetical protein